MQIGAFWEYFPGQQYEYGELVHLSTLLCVSLLLILKYVFWL